MVQMAKAYDGVNWKLLDIGLSSPQGAKCTREALKLTFNNAGAEFKNNVEGKLRRRIIAVRDAAKTTATQWEKNKKIPKKSTAHVKLVAKAADEFMVTCNAASISSVVKKDYEDNLKGIEAREKVQADLSKKLKKYCIDVNKALKSVKTKSDFDSPFWNEHVRGVGTTLPNLAKGVGLEAEHKKWVAFASESFKPKSDDDVPAQLKKIAPVLKSIAAKL